MNKEIKWIIIETLDITPSEFADRFETLQKALKQKEQESIKLNKYFNKIRSRLG